MAVPALKPEPAKTASRADPALRRAAPARRPASYGGVWENPPRYDRAASNGSVVDGDPLNLTDPEGLQIAIPAPIIEPWLGPLGGTISKAGPLEDTFDPALPVPTQPGTKGCDPCKGLRQQLASHEQKLREYMNDPVGSDNKGILGKMGPDIDKRIMGGRIRNLQNQIANFKRQLEECERNNEPIA